MTTTFQLKKTIGSSYQVDSDDTLRTKTALRSLGYYEAPSYGMTPYTDDQMFDGLKKFQRHNNLYQDGVMKRDGETAKTLGKALKDKAEANAAALSAVTSEPSDARFNSASRQDEPKHRASLDMKVTDDRKQSATELLQDKKWPTSPSFARLTGDRSQTDSPRSTVSGPAIGEQQIAAAPALPPVALAIAEALGISAVSSWAWWQSKSDSERESIRAKLLNSEYFDDEGLGPDNSNSDIESLRHFCDETSANEGKQCDVFARKYGAKAAAVCREQVQARYAACLAGKPSDEWPPLSVWVR